MHGVRLWAVITCRAVTFNDENTQDMARRANDYFEDSTGYTCHLVVSRLARVKLDPNREVEQAAQFDPIALEAYNDFHRFAATARAHIENTQGINWLDGGGGVVIFSLN